MLRRRRRRDLAPRASPRLAVGRRDILKLGAALFATDILQPACKPIGDSCLEVDDTPMPQGQDWIKGARVAGLSTHGDATACEVRPELDQLADEKVTVVEIDADLSAYLDDATFTKNVAAIDAIARECHIRGMRAVAYYPVLESLSPNADQPGTRTMSKDHPDWVQIFLDGKPNTFIGDGANGLVFWVEKGEESAWLCPTSGYVEYFLGRVEQLVRGTVLDGLWGDVPLLSDIAPDGTWPCVNPTCRARFKAENPGFAIPDKVDDNWPSWSDPVFRRWVLWRHRVIRDLEQKILARAQGARANFQVIIETVTMDYNGGTLQGLDGAAADDGGIYRVWEVDAVSDASAMRSAGIDDWYSMAVMMKHARAAASPRPTWAFSYGSQEDDAEHVMALAIAAGVSPYETRIPQMATSVGHDYRKRMFGWLAAHPEIYTSAPAHDVAVLFSSASRDALYPYKGGGGGLYATTALPAGEVETTWWSTSDVDSVRRMPYVGDYRGLCKLLFQARAAFDIVTAPHADLTTLGRYKTLVAPSPAALSPSLVDTLKTYVNGGGTLLVTGSDGGAFTDAGDPVPQPALLQALGLWPIPTAQPKDMAQGWIPKKLGNGTVFLRPDRAGQKLLNGDGSIALPGAVQAALSLATDLPLNMVFELRSAPNGDLLLLIANLDGFGAPGTFAPRESTVAVTLQRGGKRITSASIAKPDPGANDQALPLTRTGPDAIRFPLTVRTIALVTMRGATPG